LLPPLNPPYCCSRCQRPLEAEKQRFGTCYDCGFTHAANLSWVVAATYAAVGTTPWDVLMDAKFSRLASDAVAQRITLVAAGIWATIEEAAPEFFGEPRHVAVPIPSSRALIARCVAVAHDRGWPELAVEGRLQSEPRPRQTDLAADDRREAAHGKYRFSGRLVDAHVLLLDDVYTSGFTMHDAARAAREVGAADVVGVVYARRVFPDVMALYRETRHA
jgi:predicted amidophosphoribosyltransferase